MFTFSTTKLIDAPLKDVFHWCTDFQEDDPEHRLLSGQKYRMKIHEKTSDKVRYTIEWDESERSYKQNIIVNLRPPDRWYKENTGDKWDSHGEYILKSEGEKTRLTVTINGTNKFDPKTDPSALADQLSKRWDAILRMFDEERMQPAKSKTDLEKHTVT